MAESLQQSLPAVAGALQGARAATPERLGPQEFEWPEKATRDKILRLKSCFFFPDICQNGIEGPETALGSFSPNDGGVP